MPLQPWPYPRIIGHRGGGTLAPENTLAGLRKAAGLGFGGVEFDVMLSADAIPVLIHDETLERTTNGRGDVSATSYTTITGLDAGAWFAPEYRGERVPALEQAGRLCVELGLWANVEIKPAPGFERETATIVCEWARKLWAGAHRKPLLSSFRQPCLEVAQAAAPEFERGFLTDRVGADWRDAVRRLGCVSVHCNCDHLMRAQAEEVKRGGYWLLCYTVNDADTARRLFSWGVDAVFTDRLDLLPPGLT
jgi:glycerophosphoryl diester phosphodiesterase